MTDASEIGRTVRFHREAAGLTREDLSLLAGVGTTVLYDIEHGKETVKLRTLLRVLEALSIDLQLKTPLMDRFKADADREDS